MEQRKQTAVEWLEELLHFECKYSLNNEVIINYDVLDNIIMKSKQMEEDKIREAYYRGVRDEMQNIGKDFEDYYKETYGKE
jgi:hypothetical protein